MFTLVLQTLIAGRLHPYSMRKVEMLQCFCENLEYFFRDCSFLPKNPYLCTYKGKLQTLISEKSLYVTSGQTLLNEIHIHT